MMHCRFPLLHPTRHLGKKKRTTFYLFILVADIEHPLVFVVGELQSHFLLHLQAKTQYEALTAPSLFIRRYRKKGRKNIRVGRRWKN